MAVVTGVRTSQCLTAQTVTIAVAWALSPGQPGYGVSGITQSGTQTYSIVIPAGTPPEGIQNIFDTLDAGVRGANAFVTIA